SSSLPDVKLSKSPTGAYAAMGIITLLSWVLLGLSIRLNPISQAMLVGMILGTVFIFAGITMAIYRRLVYGE
ncbi:MAG: hypothetical protein QXR75_03790, partial [Thermoplasmatales archaeon]